MEEAESVASKLQCKNQHLRMHTSSQYFSGAPFLHIPPRTLLLDLPSLIQPGYSFKEIKHTQNLSVPKKFGNTETKVKYQ